MADPREPRRSALVPIVAALLVAAIGLVAWLLLRAAAPTRPSRQAAAERTGRVFTKAAPSGDPTAAANARRARDAMREQILEALKKRDAGVPEAPARPAPVAGPSPARPPSEPPPGGGKYDPKYIQQTFREEMFPLLRKCYESALERQPKLAGKLVLTFTIVGDPEVGGVVEDADFAEESDLKDDDMALCVRESLMTLTFDKPPHGGGFVSVRYPVVFSPDDEPADAAPPAAAPPDAAPAASQ